MEPDDVRYWRDQYDAFHDGFDELIDLRKERFRISSNPQGRGMVSIRRIVGVFSTD